MKQNVQPLIKLSTAITFAILMGMYLGIHFIYVEREGDKIVKEKRYSISLETERSRGPNPGE